MKVLQVLGSLTYGGAETMVMNYYRHIDKSICQIDFIVHGRGNGAYEDEVISNGSKVIHLPTAGKLGFLKYVLILYKTIINNGPYDVVHAHTNIQEGMVLLAAKMAGVPIRISHSHNTSFNTSAMKLNINRMLLKFNANKKLACGEVAGKAFYGNNDFVVVNNAVEVKKFLSVPESSGSALRTKFGISQNAIIIGHVGRFVDQKNHEFLLESFSDAVNDNPYLKLICVGEGSLLPQMKQLVKKMSIEENVYFIGSWSDMPSIYQMFDVFVLPSKHEGLPLTLVEAQVSGLRCLVADNITDECDLGLNLINYIPLDRKIWSQYFALLRKKVEITDKCRLEKAAERYNIDKQCAKLLNIYRS